MYLNLLFTLLHGHLELILSVFKAVNLVSTRINLFAQALDLKLHDIMLDKSLLFLLYDGLEVAASHLILKLKLTNDAVESLLFRLDLGNDAINIPALVLQLLV